MNITIFKPAFIVSLVAAISIPLTASADTSVFSGKGAIGQTTGANGNLRLWVDAIEYATKSKSQKEGLSVAYVSGNYYTDDTCWHGDAITDSIQFKAIGKTPNRITFSGSAQMSWYDVCGGNSQFTEEVTFNIDLNALTDQADSRWGTTHEEYGDIYKVNQHFDQSQAPASPDPGSYINSPRFGTVNPDDGFVGQVKQHTVEITRP